MLKKSVAIYMSLGLMLALLGCGNGGDTPIIAGNGSDSYPESDSMIENDSSDTILIAYFSWAGHTKQIAEEIQFQTGGDLFEIVPETPYTDDINELSGIASRELRENVRPALETYVENMDQYDMIFVGYPCWWSNAPMPVFTFLEEYSFAGKTVIPFTSYGESVWGQSLDSLQETVGKDVTIAEGLAIQEHNMQDLPARVTTWLREIGSMRK